MRGQGASPGVREQGSDFRSEDPGDSLAIQSYRDLTVWRKSMSLALEAYGLTREFPATERYGLASPVQRAATSVPANLAEDHATGSTRLFLRHLRIASGSLAEVETELILAQQLRYVDHPRVHEFLEHSAEIRRMLFSLKKSLERKLP